MILRTPKLAEAPIADAAVGKEAAPAAAPEAKPAPAAPVAPAAPAAAQVAAAPIAPVAPLPQAPQAASVLDVSALQQAAAEVQRVREEMAKTRQRDLDERRLAKLRTMGLTVDGKTITEADVLERAPKVDPHDPGAEAAFEAFRTERPGFFKPREPSLADRVGAISSLKDARFKDTKVMNYSVLATTILGGNGGRR